MRLPISWLREYVDVELDPEALADLLTRSGLEVGAIERYGVAGAELEWDRTRVLLAQLLKVDPHPNAERLVLATVDYGAEAPKVVVTGAPNLFPYLGQGDLRKHRLLSPLMLEGARYLDQAKAGKATTLKAKALRGIDNDAMLASEAELGLSDEHEGVILIEARDDDRYRVGTPIQDLLGDVVLDVNIIPNVARCASIVGLAREVAALTGQALRLPDCEVEMTGDDIAGKVVVRSEEPDLNPRFVAMLITGVEQRAAPYWMQHRLRLAGQRPINAVVDVSNYVMLELGQPNHTFDYDFLRRRADRYAPQGPIAIVTRLAQPGERLVTLDGAEHELRANNILVTDPLGNLSLGGIMGGRDSEIEPGTKNVLLEAAAWSFINIRQTSRQLGLSTEAGFRFSRGVHPSLALLGAKRAAELLRRHAGGTVARGLVDHYPRPARAVRIDLDPDDVRRLSGISIADAEIKSLLERVELEVEPHGDRFSVTVPDHRLDLEGPHDLVEEVCRMVGYDRIPSTVLSDTLPRQRGNPELEKEEQIKDLLVELGLQEVITYRLTTAAAEARVRATGSDDRRYLRLAKPSTLERVELRHDLLASVLEIVAANRRYQEHIALFEIGTVFLPVEGPLPAELTRLAIVLTGPRQAPHWEDGDARPLDFYDLKGVIESLFDGLKVEVEIAAGEHPSLRPGRTAIVRLAGGAESDNGDEKKTIGALGELHPIVVERYDLRLDDEQPVLAAVLELEHLLPAIPDAFKVDPLPAYPAVHEDLALVVDAALPSSEVETALRAAGAPLLRNVTLFDVYQDDKLGSGKKSLAYHLTFQSPSKTLSDKETAKLRGKILKQLEQELGARLRE